MPARPQAAAVKVQLEGLAMFVDDQQPQPVCRQLQPLDVDTACAFEGTGVHAPCGDGAAVLLVAPS